MADETDKIIEELERRREQRREERDGAEKRQYAIDLQEAEELEAEHGVIAAVKVARFVPGQPSRAFIRIPTRGEYKRYVDQVAKAVGDKRNGTGTRNAQETLAKSVWLYPRKDDAREAMLDVFPGLLTTIGLAAAKLAEANEEDEGKG